MLRLTCLALALVGCDDQTRPSGPCIDAPCPRLSDAGYRRSASDSGVITHWPGDSAECIDLWIDPASSPAAFDLDEALGVCRDAAAPWNDAADGCDARLCINIAGIAGRSEPVGETVNVVGRNMITWFRDRATWIDVTGGADALAVTLTQFEVRTGRLVGADILINEADYTFSAAPDGQTGRAVDFLSAFTHELGHALGFDHSEAGQVMLPRIQPGEVRRLPNAGEIAGVCEAFARP